MTRSIEVNSVVPLTPEELKDYQTLKQESIRDFGDIQRALTRLAPKLLAIEERHLYRAEYGSFADFCRETFGYHKAHCYRLIKGAKINRYLLTHGVREEDLPKNERVTRQLGRYHEKDLPAIWNATLAQAGDQEPTAKTVEAVVPTKRVSCQPVASKGWSEKFLERLQAVDRELTSNEADFSTMKSDQQKEITKLCAKIQKRFVELQIAEATASATAPTSIPGTASRLKVNQSDR